MTDLVGFRFRRSDGRNKAPSAANALAIALVKSGLIHRLRDYAVAANPSTMLPEHPNVLAEDWAREIIKAMPKGWRLAPHEPPR